MFECKVCGKINSLAGVLVNPGTDKEFHVCSDCLPCECNNGRIISCESCGYYFTPDMLHDEDVCGNTFTRCPVCGKDVVECLSFEEFKREHAYDKYAVIVGSPLHGQRAYIVSTHGGVEDVLKKLSEKTNLSATGQISIAQILLEEDEF